MPLARDLVRRERWVYQLSTVRIEVGVDGDCLGPRPRRELEHTDWNVAGGGPAAQVRLER